MTRHHVGLVYCAAVWGATFYLVKDALATVDPVTMVAYRFLIAAALLAPWVWRELRDWQALRHGALLGGFLGASYLTQTVGLKYTTAANSGFITGLFVVFVPLILWDILRRAPAPRQWCAVVIAVAGLWLLTGGLREFTVGDGLTVLTAMAYAAQVVAVDRVASRTDPLTLAFHQFWVVGMGSLAISLVGGYPLGISTTAGVSVVVFLALVPTLSAFVIQLVAQRHIPAFTVTLIFLLEPVFAAGFAWTLGGEQVTAARFAGGALIVAAMLLGEVAGKQRGGTSERSGASSHSVRSPRPAPTSTSSTRSTRTGRSASTPAAD